MNKVQHYERISFPDIVQPYYLPTASGKLRRSLSFEFSARDWTGAGFLMGKGIKMSVWKLVFKCSANISKLKGQIAASKLDLKREEELVTELRRRCFIDASMAKLELEKRRAAEMDGLESRLQIAEKNEIKSMNHLQEYLRELLETKRALRSLKAELGKDVEQDNEESFERVNDLNEKNGKELIYQMAGSEDERENDDRYASDSGLREENVREPRHEKREKENDDKEPEPERERAEEAKFEIDSIVESYDVIRSKWESWHLADENDGVINYAGADESDENQNEKRGGCFGFLRRIFCCCRRKRAKREERR